MKYKVGMYGGVFNPLHLGHINNIIKASNQCEKLYVVLSVTKNKDEINHKERLMWLKNVTADMENVEVFEIFDNSTSKDNYALEDWEKGASDVKKYISNKIDVVFAGDDYIGRNIWENLYKDSEIVYFSRKEIKISSTEIRSNPYKYFESLPSCVKKYYTKKVCIIGTESCGKTTLVKNLAKYFNTTWVKEVGRDVCEEAGGINNMQAYHYFEILYKHKKLENEALEHANKVLLIDTDALTTLYYYNLDYETTNQYNENFAKIAQGISALNNYDLYIFLEPDVKWVQDGTRTYGTEEIRKSNNIKLKNLFDENNISYISIGGNYDERYERSKKLIEEFFCK